MVGTDTMRKQLGNILVGTGFLGMTALCILQSGSRLCGAPVVQTVARAESLGDIRGDKNREGRESSQEGSDSRQKVVILTYMRSGSSLTGNILQQSPQVFYVYEPLWYIGKVFGGKYPTQLSFADDSSIELPVNMKAMNLDAVHFLQAYLDCRLGEISVEILMQWTSRMSRAMGGFLRCTNGNKTQSIVRGCIKSLSRSCQQRKVSAVKLIRASMQEMHFLLHSDPNVKVIHLMRDPRAALRSRNSVGEFRWNDIKAAANKMCSRVWDDLQMSSVLRRRFPGRLLTVRYEDIVRSPLEAAQQMYDYLGLKFTPDVESFVWNSTYGGLPDDCNICTTRSNATATANRWRTEVGRFPQILLAQAECASVMEALGYKVLATPEEISDQRFPSTLEDYGMESLLKVDIRQGKNTQSQN